MGSLGVVVSPPLFDDDLSLFEGIEDLPIEQFVPEAGIEGLAVAVLPGRAEFNVSGIGPHRLDPSPDRLGHKLGSIV